MTCYMNIHCKTADYWKGKSNLLQLAWGGAKLFFIGAGEGGVVGEAAELGGFQDWGSLGDLGAGKKKPFAGDVVVDGVAGFFFELSHHVVLAEIVFPGKGFDGEVFGQVVVDVAEKLFNLGIAAVGAGIVDVLLFQENAVYINHELGEKGSAKKLTAEFFIFQGGFQFVEQLF